MKQILITIDETGASRPQDEKSIFNKERFYFSSPQEAREFLKERYGKIPSGKNKIYTDDYDQPSQPLGFTYSFWNKDYSHNSKSWHQTDWICIYEVEKHPAPQLINLFIHK